MVHEELPASDAPQVPAVVSAKGAVAEIVRVCTAVELFVTVKENAVLVESTPTFPKLWVAGVSLSGAAPVPVRAMVKGLPVPV